MGSGFVGDNMKQLFHPTPSHEELHRELNYNPVTGLFKWHHPGKGRRSNLIAGTYDNRKGYLSIWFGERFYKAHRLAWKMMTGKDPVEQIDHIDNDTRNNSFDNLREATNGQNRHNIKASKTSKSGIKGVSYVIRARKWRGYVTVNGVKTGKETFLTKEDAEDYVKALRVQLCGDFVRHD